MWKTFQYDREPYIIKFIVEENVFTLLLSNLRILWKEKLSLEDCLGRFKEINPFLESTEEGVQEEIAAMINNINETLITEMNHNDTSVSLTINTSLETHNIKFKFILSKLPDDTFFSEVTVPLIHTIKYLEESHKMMSDLLRKKDRELEEYKLEKGNISREDLITKPFVSSALEIGTQNSLMMNLYTNAAWSKFSEEFGDTRIDEERNTNKVSNNERTVKRRVYSSKSSKKEPVFR